MAPPARTREVFEVLRECAENMYTESYGEIAHRVGLAASGIGYQLGWIRDNICRRHGLPWINLLAVNKEEWFPGESFLPEGFQGSEADQRTLWRGMVLHVFAYDWRHVEFDALAAGAE
jgi:hypothetical protein